MSPGLFHLGMGSLGVEAERKDLGRGPGKLEQMENPGSRQHILSGVWGFPSSFPEEGKNNQDFYMGGNGSPEMPPRVPPGAPGSRRNCVS